DFTTAYNVSKLNSANVSSNGVVNGLSRKRNGVAGVGLSSRALNRKFPHPSSLSSYNLSRASRFSAMLSILSSRSLFPDQRFLAGLALAKQRKPTNRRCDRIEGMSPRGTGGCCGTGRGHGCLAHEGTGRGS